VTDLERMGGRSSLERVIDAFVERVAADMVIGFLFTGRDLARIKRHEVEHAARHLGGAVPYTGRPIAAAHRPLKINAGQFRRRLAILRTVATDKGVPADVVERWVAADAKLERAVTDGSDCVG
jgi:hemoglobin